MQSTLPPEILETARTQNAWQSKPVDTGLLHRIYDLAKMGPTSMNCSPLRVVYITTDEAKERLMPTLAEGNRGKVKAAPVCAILAHDTEFHRYFDRLFPHSDVAPMFRKDPQLAFNTMFRNSSLQCAYFMIAARSFGLDCGPMSGLNTDAVDKEFFSDSTWRTNFVCCLGYGDPEGLFPRLPRLDFEDACILA